MMEKLPAQLRADATEGKEQGRNQNKEEEPPGHEPGELEAFCQWLLAAATTGLSISASFMPQSNDSAHRWRPLLGSRIANRHRWAAIR